MIWGLERFSWVVQGLEGLGFRVSGLGFRVGGLLVHALRGNDRASDGFWVPESHARWHPRIQCEWMVPAISASRIYFLASRRTALSCNFCEMVRSSFVGHIAWKFNVGVMLGHTLWCLHTGLRWTRKPGTD